VSQSSPEKSATFDALHRRGEILLLPNAWDAASAKLFERAGALAIATTSSGVAQSLGYPDGNVLPRDVAVAAVARIARVVQVPVSADIEEGYGATPEEVCGTIERIVDAGAVGINLEDGAKEPGVLAAKIEAIRKRLEQLGVRLFVNARADAYLRRLPSPLEETLRRGALYREAGADGFFVPGIRDPQEIGRVRAEIELPLNVLAVPGLAAPAELAKLGVARLSAGGGVMHASYGFAERCARAFLHEGRTDVLFEGAIPHAELNRLFQSKEAV
jgi:2-methylisocitrate lyase-like PEP mutase family enzyme